MNETLYHTALHDAAWRDMTHFGRFRVTGSDVSALLHHLTTNDINALRDGQSREAALVSSKARVLDWLSVWRDGGEFSVVTSPNRRELFAPHARRFVLFRQDVSIIDETNASVLWGLFGPRAATILRKLNAPPDVDATHDHVVEVECDGVHFMLSKTNRLPHRGWLLWSKDTVGMQRLIRQSEAPICDDATYNVLRVEAGVPVAGLELTEEINPWEARLDDLVSLSKGCYNGQEVVARLNTYQKIKQRLCGLKLERAISMGARATLQRNSRVAGFVSSSVLSPRFGPIALAYVRSEFEDAGTALKVLCAGDEAASNEQAAIVAALPFEEKS